MLVCFLVSSIGAMLISGVHSDREEGDKLKLREIQDAVRNDKKLQDALLSEEAMAELREEYEEGKAEERVTAVRVSKRAQAKVVSEKINLFQQEVCFDQAYVDTDLLTTLTFLV